jgi:hypothetical protein
MKLGLRYTSHGRYSNEPAALAEAAGFESI